MPIGARAVLFGDGRRGGSGLGDEAGSAAAFGGGIAYIDPRLPILARA